MGIGSIYQWQANAGAVKVQECTATVVFRHMLLHVHGGLQECIRYDEVLQDALRIVELHRRPSFLCSIVPWQHIKPQTYFSFYEAASWGWYAHWIFLNT